VTVHPATLLLVWVGLVFLLQPLSVTGLAVAAVVLMPLSMLFARKRALSLLRRARWLLASIVILFALATPGQRLPGTAGDMGITLDGVILATEHALRLVLLLATLALLHQRLGSSGMMSGLYWLLAPLANWRMLRERIVVRLMLVLDYVEAQPSGNWRQWLVAETAGPDSVDLAIAPVRALDWAVLASLSMLALVLGWTA
jgi:hypothetical protein